MSNILSDCWAVDENSSDLMRSPKSTPTGHLYTSEDVEVKCANSGCVMVWCTSALSIQADSPNELNLNLNWLLNLSFGQHDYYGLHLHRAQGLLNVRVTNQVILAEDLCLSTAPTWVCQAHHASNAQRYG